MPPRRIVHVSQNPLVEQQGPSMLPLQVALFAFGPHTGRLGGGGADMRTSSGSASTRTVNVHDRLDFIVAVFFVGSYILKENMKMAIKSPVLRERLMAFTF